MKLKHRLILLMCLISNAGFSQNSKIDSLNQLEQKYQDYFGLNRENAFLHLNKTKVLPTEGIWFSAYVINSVLMKPNMATNNLHVNLYNDQGKLLNAKTVFIYQGKGAGYFKLDTLKVRPGKYLIKAFTENMKNYKEDLTYTQTFKVLGEPEKTDKNKSTNYDLQLLPEGGHFLKNVDNSVAVKLINDKGEGVYFENAQLLNQDDKVIKTFKSNQFGMGKFNFLYHGHQKYYIKLTPENDNPIRVEIPDYELFGLTMTLNNYNPNKLFILLKTNEKTVQKIKGKKFYLSIHREGHIKSIPFYFPNDKLEAVVPISKDLFVGGVNIITIFDEAFQPILERQVFIRKGINRKRIKAKLIRSDSDSLTVKLSPSKPLADNHLSISVLPKGTKAYTPQNNLLSAFYIAPYIKGKLENGAYYFSDDHQRQVDYDLDLLMMTQGWHKYNWHHIFKGKPPVYHQPEHGFVISGKVNNYNTAMMPNLSIASKKYHIFEMVDLDKKHQFKTRHLFLRDSALIHFSIRKAKNGKMVEPKIYARVSPLRDKKNTDIKKQYFLGLDNIRDKTLPTNEINDAYFSSENVLKTVFIKAKTTEKHHDARSAFVFGNHIKIDDDMANHFFYITDLIEAHGFAVNRNMSDLSITTTYATSQRGVGHPGIELDGVALSNLDPLLNLETKDVEDIYIDKMGSVRGMNGSAGYIQIFTKSGMGITGSKKSIPNSQSLKMKNGYAAPKAFYTPKYKSYNDDIFSRYGVIDWIGDFTLDKNHQTIQIFQSWQKDITLFIEGFTTQGEFISEQIDIATR